MKIIDKIYISKYVPSSTGVLWIDLSDSSKWVTKVYLNGSWQPTQDLDKEALKKIEAIVQNYQEKIIAGVGVHIAADGKTISVDEGYGNVVTAGDVSYDSTRDTQVGSIGAKVTSLSSQIGHIVSDELQTSASSISLLISGLNLPQGEEFDFRLVGTTDGSRIIVRANSPYTNNLKDYAQLETWYRVTPSVDVTSIYLWHQEVTGQLAISIEIKCGMAKELDGKTTYADVKNEKDSVLDMIQEVNVINKWIDGSFVNYSNGNLSADTDSSYTDYIKAVGGAKYYANLSLGGNRGIAFYNESKAYISGINSYTNNVFEVPASAKYMRITCITASKETAFVRIIGSINCEVLNNTENVASNICRNIKWEIGKFINYANGRTDTNSSYALTDFVRVQPNTTYKTNVLLQGNAGICFYDFGKRRLGTGINTLADVHTENGVRMYGKFTTPANAQFMRVSHYNGNNNVYDVFMRCEGGVDDMVHDSASRSYVATEMMRDVIVQQHIANPYKFVQTNKCYIAFHFDDGEPTISQMVELFHTKNVPLCLAIPRLRLATICSNNKTILENCTNVEADGGEIMTHSLDYMNADSTEADIRAFFEWNKEGLVRAGLHPYGVVNAGGGAEIGSVPNLEWLKRYAYSTHKYGIFFTALEGDVHFNYVRTGLSYPLSTLQSTIAAKIQSHQSIIFNAHAAYDVDPNSADGGWVAKVGALIDYIVNNFSTDDYEFVNTSTWIEKTQKSAAQLFAETL